MKQRKGRIKTEKQRMIQRIKQRKGGIKTVKKRKKKRRKREKKKQWKRGLQTEKGERE